MSVRFTSGRSAGRDVHVREIIAVVVIVGRTATAYFVASYEIGKETVTPKRRDYGDDARLPSP